MLAKRAATLGSGGDTRKTVSSQSAGLLILRATLGGSIRAIAQSRGGIRIVPAIAVSLDLPLVRRPALGISRVLAPGSHRQRRPVCAPRLRPPGQARRHRARDVGGETRNERVAARMNGRAAEGSRRSVFMPRGLLAVREQAPLSRRGVGTGHAGSRSRMDVLDLCSLRQRSA
jgi:hypothetical protein